ncbi:glycoside hydrolase family 47 protein [Cylindrobasidium torrendii FP15055 ss-10]|uniref:alpha-1,2-Mannosidase n=1 Tax=Cylindrobasidium torrendii FP15055 ss-10 TaxID=1314674 RepID=A0A0D7BFB5_9AGAR|nr:glycoside hydrolase family 47 protein [Cylindrobasidium torrendii FP15055 ss-10]
MSYADTVLRSIRQKALLRTTLYVSFFFLLIWGVHRLFIPTRSLSSSFGFGFGGKAGQGDEGFVPRKRPAAWGKCAAEVREAFLHGYRGYEREAAPHDELRPVQGGYADNFNGWGVTLFDSLDTMLLMDTEEEFQRARDIIATIDFSLPPEKYAPYFETVIRYLGGLLSAYALRKDPLFLERAEELAGKLDGVFDTPSGLARFGVNPRTGAIGPEIGILAEIGSLQVEYTYLAKITGKKHYFERADTVVRVFQNANLKATGGMLPVGWNTTSGQPADFRLSAGAQADSAHEYLLKQYLLTGRADQYSLGQYIRATTQIITNLMYVSPTRHLLYVTDTRDSLLNGTPKPSQTMEHLSCFLPGLFALGVHTLPWDNLDRLGFNLDALAAESGLDGIAGEGYRRLNAYDLKKVHVWAAEGLAETCWVMYADQRSGLAPDEVVMPASPQSFKAGGSKGWDRGEDDDADAEEADADAENAEAKAEADTSTNTGTKGKEKRAKQSTPTKPTRWIDVLDQWKRAGSRGVPPGTKKQERVVYREAGVAAERKQTSADGRDYATKKKGYLLRPETVETFYVMWKVTGDVKWRERAWEVFDAIQTHTKTPRGYASISDTDTSSPKQLDEMPSYFLAETLKYIYLTFMEEDVLPLDKWVLNTEAHPLPVFEWTAEERKKFGVKGYLWT